MKSESNQADSHSMQLSNFAQKSAALLGASGIACMAYGAHGLEKWADATQVGWWRTGANLHFLGALALLALASRLSQGAPARASLYLLIAGTVIFSGSLYAMTLGAPRFLGAITPLGGLSLIIAFLLLLRSPSASAEKS